MERPLGYDEAKPGETFLKIGVGELEKPKEEKYNFAGKYKIVRPAEWKPIPFKAPLSERAIKWSHTASLPSGYGYYYLKVVYLVTERPMLRIIHRIRNTGTKPITTDFYNHNFFNVDRDPVGPNYRFAFPFEIKAKDLRGRFGELVALDGKDLRFRKELSDGFVMAGLTGFDPNDDRHREFELRHGPSGIRVGVIADYPIAKLNVWGIRSTICPEPFMQIDGLKPGEWKQWAIEYRFEHDPPKK
jgi:galactose mutarotase-like enzyme